MLYVNTKRKINRIKIEQKGENDLGLEEGQSSENDLV